MSFGVLVQRLGSRIRDSYRSHELDVGGDDTAGSAAEEFPDDLQHMRSCVAHHLIPLLLLARSDNDFAPEERDIIVDHCLSVASQRGVTLEGARRSILVDYVSTCRPSLLQLDPALSALVHAPHEEVGELIRAAHRVIEADGVNRPEELHFFVQLSADLDAMLA